MKKHNPKHLIHDGTFLHPKTSKYKASLLFSENGTKPRPVLCKDGKLRHPYYVHSSFKQNSPVKPLNTIRGWGTGL